MEFGPAPAQQSEDPRVPAAPCPPFPLVRSGLAAGQEAGFIHVHTCTRHQVRGFAGKAAPRVGLSLPGALQTPLCVSPELSPGMQGGVFPALWLYLQV